MFLLVNLIILDLRNPKSGSHSKLRSSPAEVRRTLQSLPKTLGQAYGGMLESVEEDDRMLAMSVLRCILYSARRLTAKELCVAIAMTHQPTTIDELEEEMSLSLLYDLNLIFGPLIQADEGYIGFMHASVKEFLLTVSGEAPSGQYFSIKPTLSTVFDTVSNALSVADSPWYCIPKDKANAAILSLCFDYLHIAGRASSWEKPTSSRSAGLSKKATSNGNLEEIYDEDEDNGDSLEDVSTMSITAPLLQSSSGLYRQQPNFNLVNARMRKSMLLLLYIAENLDEHCRRVSSSDRDTRSKIMQFFNGNNVQFWIKLYWSFRDRERISNNLGPLHMACLLGLKSLVEDMLKDKWNWKTRASGPFGSFTTPLEMAVEGGDCETVKLLLDNGADVKWRYKERREILATAAWYGHNAIIDLLLTRGVNLFVVEVEDYTALDAAIEAGRESTVLHLIECAKKNKSTTFTHSLESQHGFPGYPIQTAVKYQRTTIIRALANAGFSLENANKAGYIPFHLAASIGSLEVLKASWPRRDIDCRTKDGHTAFLIAAESLQKMKVEYLLDQGADINARFQERTALEIAIRGAFHDKAGDNLRKIIRLLLDRGIEISDKDETEIINSVLSGDNVPAFELLLTHGIKGKGVVDFGPNWESIYYALAHKAQGCAFALLDGVPNEERRATLEHQDKSLQTALHFAAENLQTEPTVFDRILQEGAKVDPVDIQGRTPLYCILAKPSWNMDFEIVRKLLEHKANPNLKAKDGLSPVAVYFEATTEGQKHLELLRIVVKYDFDLKFDNLTYENKLLKYTTIKIRPVLWHMLAEPPGKLRDMAQQILDNGQLTEKQCQEGFNWALKKKNKVILDALSVKLTQDAIQEELGTQLMTMFYDRAYDFSIVLDHPALDLNRIYYTSNRRGPAYPLCEAAERGLTRVVEKMLELGASIDVKNPNGKTATQLAWDEGHRQLAHLLEEKKKMLARGSEQVAEVP